MYLEIFCAPVCSLAKVCRDRFVLVAIEDVIEMSSKSCLELASCLSYILYFANFASDTIYEVGATAGNIFHSVESFLRVSAGDCPRLVQEGTVSAGCPITPIEASFFFGNEMRVRGCAGTSHSRGGCVVMRPCKEVQHGFLGP